MKRPIRPIVGILALFLAATGLIVAIFGPDIAEAIEPSAPLEEQVADLAVRVKDAVIAKMKDREATIESKAAGFSWHSAIPKIALGLGALGLIAGAISYTRGENRAFAIAAGGLGVVALAWEAMMISIAAIIVLVIIFAVLNSLGIDISF